MIVTYNKISPDIIITDITETGYYFVHVVKKITSEDESIFYSNIVLTSSSTSVLTDGMYKVISIKLPNTNTGSYYTNGLKIFDSTDEEISVTLLLENVEGTTQNVVIYFNLHHDLINVEKDILDLLYSCKSDPVKSRYRDILYMGENVLEDLLSKSLFNEANRLIEKLVICGNTQTTCNCR